MKIGGERAYRLARRGVAVEMPLRRSQVYALDVIAYTATRVQLGLHVSSGTYVRSIADGARRPLPDAAPNRGRARSGSRRPIRSGCSRSSEALGRLPAEARRPGAGGLRAQVLALETRDGVAGVER